MSSRSKLVSVVGAVGVGVLLAIVLLVALGAGRASLAQGGSGIVRVATTGSDAPGCGRAANPCRSLQYAVNAAQIGDEIRVAAGVYTGVQNIPVLSSATFTATQLVAINKRLTLRGGYSTADWTTSRPQTQPTILDAQRQGRVLVITGTAQVTVEGLHITGGRATGLGGYPSGHAGGGVYVYGTTVIVSNCQIYANAAVSETTGYDEGAGGGLYLEKSASSTLRGNNIYSNTASWNGHGHGRGVYLNDCAGATLEQNLIRSNRGTQRRNGNGGGIAIYWSSDVILRANDISDNTGGRGANYRGGGLLASGCNRLQVIGNTFEGNLAGGAWSWGGALMVGGASDLTVSGNRFVGNTASLFRGWGGAMHLVNVRGARVSENLLLGNQGSSDETELSWGGGMRLQGGWPLHGDQQCVCRQQGQRSRQWVAG